jgi:hypothetical protein
MVAFLLSKFDKILLVSIKIYLLLFFISASNIIHAQDCAAIIESTYFSYPANSNDSGITHRSKDKLIETDLRSGDSTTWKIKWTGKCTYEAEYVSGSKKLEPDVRNYLKEHKFAFKVVTTTRDYFIIEAYNDKIKGKPFSVDTAFFQRKTYPVSKVLFQQVKSPGELKKQKFSDTSKYAVVCLYRKGQFSCSIVTGEIFFGGNLMAVLPNRSAGMFKILKEGSFEIESYAKDKDKSVKKTIKIQFGKKYYIRFDPVLFHSCGLEIFVEEGTEAKEDFESLL